jgi:hypothetical protein
MTARVLFWLAEVVRPPARGEPAVARARVLV